MMILDEIDGLISEANQRGDKVAEDTLWRIAAHIIELQRQVMASIKNTNHAIELNDKLIELNGKLLADQIKRPAVKP